MMTSAPRPFGGLAHARHRTVAAGNRQVGAERFRQRALVGAARDADDGGAPRLGELHVQLTGDTEAQDHDELAGEDVDLPLRVQARREYLNERRRARVHGLRQREHVARRNGDELGKAAVPVPSDQHAVRAQVRLPDAAVEARPAIELRIDDDAIAAAQRLRARANVHHFARHLVAHDSRIATGMAPLKIL